jgi:hypothetical protein
MKGYQMANGGFLVVEYAPTFLDNEDFRPVRMDGHYAEKQDAEEIAQMWAEESLNAQTRIVVVEVVAETKQPDFWNKA